MLGVQGQGQITLFASGSNVSLWPCLDNDRTSFKSREVGCLHGSVGWASAFGSGLDPPVLGSSPTLGSLLGGRSASPSAPHPTRALSHSGE